MATYPSLHISRTTTVDPAAGIQAEVADDGTLKFRKDGSVTAFAILIVHEWLDDTDLATLKSFISSNGYGPHSFTVRGTEYTITLINDPKVTEHRGSVQMVQVPALGVEA